MTDRSRPTAERHRGWSCPSVLEGNYGVRFVCRRISGNDVNVHLPLGETSVVLTLEARAGSRDSSL